MGTVGKMFCTTTTQMMMLEKSQLGNGKPAPHTKRTCYKTSTRRLDSVHVLQLRIHELFTCPGLWDTLETLVGSSFRNLGTIVSCTASCLGHVQLLHPERACDRPSQMAGSWAVAAPHKDIQKQMHHSLVLSFWVQRFLVSGDCFMTNLGTTSLENMFELGHHLCCRMSKKQRHAWHTRHAVTPAGRPWLLPVP